MSTGPAKSTLCTTKKYKSFLCKEESQPVVPSSFILSQTQQLFQAIDSENEQLILNLLQDSSCSLDFQNEDGFNALSYALAKYKINAFSIILKNGSGKININAQTKKGMTILHGLILTQNTALLDEVVELYPEVNPNIEDFCSNSPIFIALEYELYEFVETFLNLGKIDLFQKNKKEILLQYVFNYRRKFISVFKNYIRKNFKLEFSHEVMLKFQKLIPCEKQSVTEKYFDFKKSVCSTKLNISLLNEFPFIKEVEFMAMPGHFTYASLNKVCFLIFTQNKLQCIFADYEKYADYFFNSNFFPGTEILLSSCLSNITAQKIYLLNINMFKLFINGL